MSSRIVEIDLPFGQDPPGLYCPMCGKPVHGENIDPSCQHILFTYLDAAGGFMYVKPEVAKIVDKISDDENEDSEDLLKKLMKKINRKSAMCLSVTSSGMAGGPVSYTTYVGIDFAESKDEVE